MNGLPEFTARKDVMPWATDRLRRYFADGTEPHPDARTMPEELPPAVRQMFRSTELARWSTPFQNIRPGVVQ